MAPRKPRKAPLPKPTEILTEQARPMVGSIISPHRVSSADGLTPARLGSLIRDSDKGNVQAYLTLASEIEERDSHLASVISTRKLAVSGTPVHVEAASDSAHDVAIAEAVERLVARPEFSGLVLDLLDGIMKGFSAVEIIWDKSESSWEPIRYDFREQRHFTFDQDTLTTPRLRSLTSPMDGEPLTPGKWLVHTPKLRSGPPLRAGLARTAALNYMAKRFDLESWLKYLEVFSIPARVGKYPVSAADQKRALLTAIQALGTDSCAVIPEEMTVEFLQSGNTGNNQVFIQTADYFDQQNSKLVLGQTLTTDSGGGSYAQGKVHNGVRQDIRRADALAVCATIGRDLIRWYVDLNFGAQKLYPSIVIPTEEPEDITQLMTNVKTFVNLGGQVEMSSLRDRLGLPEPAKGSVLLVPESLVGGGTQVGLPEVSNGQANLKRELFAAPKSSPSTTDEIDDLVDEALSDWASLLDPNVGELLRQVFTCQSYDEALALVERLKEDAGQVLDIEALTRSLTRNTFLTRGIGDSKDPS